mgnify:CR=1 FL=1
MNLIVYVDAKRMALVVWCGKEGDMMRQIMSLADASGGDKSEVFCPEPVIVAGEMDDSASNTSD